MIMNGTPLVRGDANGFTYDGATNTVSLTDLPATRCRARRRRACKSASGVPPAAGRRLSTNTCEASDPHPRSPAGGIVFGARRPGGGLRRRRATRRRRPAPGDGLGRAPSLRRRSPRHGRCARQRLVGAAAGAARLWRHRRELRGGPRPACPRVARGFVLVAPDGTLDRTGQRFWNATDACCNFFGDSVDDVAYLHGLVREVAAAYHVDSRRIQRARVVQWRLHGAPPRLRGSGRRGGDQHLGYELGGPRQVPATKPGERHAG